MRTILILAIILGSVLSIQAQTGQDTVLHQRDSVVIADSIKRSPLPAVIRSGIDPVSKRPQQDHHWSFAAMPRPDSLRSLIQLHHPWLGFGSVPYTLHAPLRVVTGKEIVFYAVVFLLILFAALKQAFPKYFNDLFRVFFRTTIKQRQVRDQLMQTPLPSLMMNIFFILSGSMYAAFVFQHYQLNPVGNFWLMVLYCGIGLSLAYALKYIGLRVSGWLFNMQEASSSYIFIVFIVNKMIGILLLPFIILVAFTTGNLNTIAFTLSYCLIGGLLLYRFILSFAAIRNQVSINPFHFLLYLLAFEIAPLLLVYKGLLLYFRQTA